MTNPVTWNTDRHEHSRRAASVPISFHHLNKVLMMPEGMTITHIEVDHALATLHFIVTHPDLTRIVDRDQIPTLAPVMTEFDYGVRSEAEWGELGTVSRPEISDT